MMTRETMLGWLRQDDDAALFGLWSAADEVRRQQVGDEVHLRGLIEISNVCTRLCTYCGISAASSNGFDRYRMTQDEILECAGLARDFGYGTVVLQAGEDPQLKGEWIAELVGEIKSRYGLAVTLSLGERPDDELRMWREAGADRYLLRLETSDRELFRRIHPPRTGGPEFDRVAMLGRLRQMGYEIGSGVMIGIPGQSYESLTDDIELFGRLDLDMIGVGPYIADPATPLGRDRQSAALPDGHQVQATELMTYKVVALSRLMCPQANIPSTSALATLNIKQGRELGLQRGANILMPNLTPTHYRQLYQIYPAKACIMETAAACHGCMRGRIISIGRHPGTGAGGRSK